MNITIDARNAPALTNVSQSMKAVSDVNSLGLHTHVQPAAMQGAIFHESK